MAAKDDLGKRIKDNYESRYDIKLPKRSYIYCRIDGQAFHTFTSGLNKPFDYELIDDLIKTTEYVCSYVSNVKFGFYQSDEISLLMTDIESIETEPFFDNKLQKLCSIVASHFTAYFNKLRWARGYKNEMATFDARFMVIADPWEVINTFVWRQRDIERNSLSMLAQANFPHKQLEGKKKADLHEMLHGIGINWNDLPGICKRGALIEKRKIVLKDGTERTRWIGDAAPSLRKHLPTILPQYAVLQ